MSIGGNIRRATLEIVVLRLLNEQEYYVYDLLQKIKELSGGFYTVPEATIYPVMYRLLEKGFIKDREVQVGRRVRVYYSVTEEGKSYYENIFKEYSETMAGLQRIFEEVEKNDK